MRQFKKRQQKSPLVFSIFFTLLLAIISTGCSPKVGLYTQRAYENATSIKAQSLIIMDKATTPYSNNVAEIDRLVLAVEQAYQYSKGLPKNDLAAKQWEIIKDPSRNLLGGFLKRWKDKGKMGRAIVNASKGIVADSFDTIVKLEVGKMRSN